MLLGTHALLPVDLCLAVECTRLARGRGYSFAPWTLPLAALFGILPDLCSPHISLEDRHQSWSHTVFFLAGLLPVVAMVASLLVSDGPPRWRSALAFWLAAALHLAADAISGGIAPLYPWRPVITGDYYLPPAQWLWWDAGFAVLTWVLIRLRPRAVESGMRRPG